MTTPEVVWRLDAELGEGPIWLVDEQAVRFVDIKRGLLHRYHPASNERETIAVGGNPSFIVPASDGGLLVGSECGIFTLKDYRLGGPLTLIPQPSHNRTNDATVDCHGRLWFGTMDDQERVATGAIWLLEPGVLHNVGGAAVVTNGPAVSPDGQIIYHSDSVERTIWRSRLGPGPRLVESDIFVQLEDGEGHPDGIVVDMEGCLWVGMWDGWSVRRYAPDGKLLQIVSLPCARVTKVALGGPDLTTAYVTTARVGLSNAELAKQPLAGSLFAFEAPAPGQRIPSVQIPPSPAQAG